MLCTSNKACEQASLSSLRTFYYHAPAWKSYSSKIKMSKANEFD